MNFQQRVEKAIRKKPKDEIKVFHEACFVLAKEFGWSYQDIIGAPIPFVLGLLQELQNYNKLQEKEMKRARNK